MLDVFTSVSVPQAFVEDLLCVRHAARHDRGFKTVRQGLPTGKTPGLNPHLLLLPRRK